MGSLSGLDSGNLRFIKDGISKYKAKRVAIQLPEGLKARSRELIDKISSLGVEVLFFADPCFGACDIPDYFAKKLGCDMIIHFAHSQFVKKTAIPVIYVEYQYEADKGALKVAEENIAKLKGYRSVGLLATVQHIKTLHKVKELLESRGFKVYLGKPKIAKYEGQVLGCDQSGATGIAGKVDCFLYVGTGEFHPLGVARISDKPVFILDAEKKELRDLKAEYDKYLARTILKKAKFDDASNIGLIVTTKSGQMNRNVFSIKKRIESLGKKVYVIAMDYVSYDKIEGTGIDFLVNTACPRLEEDVVFGVPLLDWDTLNQYI